MCERHPIPCWLFVDSPCSQGAGECHNNHKCIKQYDKNRTAVTSCIKVNDVMIEITFTSLTANGSLSIVHMSMYGTHIIMVWSCTLVGSQLFKTTFACHRRLSIANRRHEHEYAPVPVQWRRCRECWEQLTPIVCDRWQHMPVIREGLQTGSSLHCQGGEMPYLERRWELGWKEPRKSEPRHCMY